MSNVDMDEIMAIAIVSGSWSTGTSSGGWFDYAKGDGK